MVFCVFLGHHALFVRGQVFFNNIVLFCPEGGVLYQDILLYEAATM